MSKNKDEEEDYIDRFDEVAKGLGLEKIISNKIGCFIHYEIMSAKIKARESERQKIKKLFFKKR